jgi:hypothetical protein
MIAINFKLQPSLTWGESQNTSVSPVDIILLSKKNRSKGEQSGWSQKF